MYQYLLLDMLPGYHWFRVHSCVFYLHSQAIWRVSFKSGFVPCSPQESLAYLVQRITYTTNHIYNESHIQWITYTMNIIEWHIQWMTCTMNDIYNEWHVQWMTYTTLQVWQLQCLGIFMEQFGPWTSTDVQMEGNVLYLSRLHGVVPGVWVIVGHSLDHTSMSRKKERRGKKCKDRKKLTKTKRKRKKKEKKTEWPKMNHKTKENELNFFL